MHIHLLQVVKDHRLRSNKDTNGGYGTVNDFGQGLVANLLKRLKNRTMNFPELLPAYLQAILKNQGHRVTYAENEVPPEAELVLLQTSIISYSTELAWIERLRRERPDLKIGLVGGMSAANAQRYAERADFVLTGEAENALLQHDIGSLSGIVDGGKLTDLDSLPFPDWSHLSQSQQRYGFVLSRKGRFLPMLTSRGCPMSCRYYCTYPLVQGAHYRPRSPENVVAEIDHLQKQYGMSTVMFRDPIFSLQMERVAEICELILQKGLKFSWICETHPRFLNAELIELMRRAGCTAVKLGIESGNLEVMKKSKRAAPDLLYQEEVVRLLEQNDIDVLAFYILGYMDDTAETIRQTVDYAIHLNTYGAQFTIATPYPGTPWYEDLHRQNEDYALDENLENYTQYRLVFNHPHLSVQELEQLKSQAYRRYYLRPAYVQKNLMRLGRG